MRIARPESSGVLLNFSCFVILPIQLIMGLPSVKGKIRMQLSRDEMGRADTFRFNVLTHVVHGEYDRAIEALKGYLEKPCEFPKFKPKIERLVLHCIDLVNAIRVKKNFPGMQYLTMAKQQEITDKAQNHLDELDYTLKRIEKIYVDVRLDDVRSTVWVVRAAIHAAVLIAVVAFALEVYRGVGSTANYVIDDYLDRATDWLFELF